jgi:hypothetical protein
VAMGLPKCRFGAPPNDYPVERIVQPRKKEVK